MNITITWQSFITAAALVGAVVALVTYFSKVVRWVDKQSKQDEEIKNLKQHHEDDIAEMKQEQTLLVYGVLACLKGLKEQGCNGPVTDTINEYEKYLNQKAHK
jgi:hypothetical protein